jgi:ribonuclease-3
VSADDGTGLAELADRLGHRFADMTLLRRAMAHRSWCAETPGEESNERLEFLGDAVLGWLVTDVAYRRYADLAEGKLTDLRKSVVNASALAEVARSVGIGPHLLLGRGERAAGGADKDSILCDAFEAALGAVYLDGGADAAMRLVERWITPRLEVTVGQLDRLDRKTQLQELAVRLLQGVPEYDVRSEGPDHAKRFFATVSIAGTPYGGGTGTSKKSAEQAAATMAIDALTALELADVEP